VAAWPCTAGRSRAAVGGGVGDRVFVKMRNFRVFIVKRCSFVIVLSGVV
jgi:hypothetical protein